MALHIEGNRAEMYTSEPATALNVYAGNISPLQIKVNLKNRKYNGNHPFNKHIQ